MSETSPSCYALVTVSLTVMYAAVTKGTQPVLCSNSSNIKIWFRHVAFLEIVLGQRFIWQMKYAKTEFSNFLLILSILSLMCILFRLDLTENYIYCCEALTGSFTEQSRKLINTDVIIYLNSYPTNLNSVCLSECRHGFVLVLSR